ncbi:EscE/YscE/SsaE family type III secretion system needle protein co-chaperone [Photorhabdus heterorhabditis]|uniref:EscE/YscE/SsaE family type III secretion system needle protein co-chaperone n=1 Tax=Photorhabdus heterorhabditis TaxID=880156 RepID=UPI0015623CC3|nr:EscE/YscE/SsaE family type III secretion system needle protein co-chaperone [Photorhabdus heterorhabditis]NRN30073.1 EscE/YscE/SsaE family type III secretion system needle protein co-chaperone [Photorhabdus heterorhabditis subsp. aluminescens]
MMTSLEARLFGADPDYVNEIQHRLSQALNDIKQRLRRGGSVQEYQQWQLEADAIQAAMTILSTTEGGHHG